jgi:phage anti-repressor protein
MNDLIQINQTAINGADVNSVNARELYSSLELGKGQYTRWITQNLINNEFFNVDIDYIRVRHNVEGNDTIDHIVSLDVAKHLSMMAKTKKAHELRTYFIDFEKKAKNIINSQSNEIQLLQQMVNTIAKTDERVTTLEQTKRLESWQEKALQDAKNTKVYELAKIMRTGDESRDKTTVSKLHRQIWSVFKKKYHLPRYSELPSIKFNEAKAYIDSLTFADLL